MKYIRRIVWFFATRLLVLCLILGIVITVFYYAMNLSNIQIILKDGMANRAKVIMGVSGVEDTELSRYFQTACLEGDSALNTAKQGNSPYADYNVRGIDHRLDLSFFWLWPWENSVRVTISESVPRIDGRAKGLKADELIARDGAEALYPPAWPDARYRVLLAREGGQWKIRSLTPIQTQ